MRLFVICFCIIEYGNICFYLRFGWKLSHNRCGESYGRTMWTAAAGGATIDKLFIHQIENDLWYVVERMLSQYSFISW